MYDQWLFKRECSILYNHVCVLIHALYITKNPMTSRKF
jgi:hypothetical protein